jgi:hypothetical protein|tara:strand:+ start:2117 stop:2338 length:222 start_codon:yes stop_codon:yes gene_type:complete
LSSDKRPAGFLTGKLNAMKSNHNFTMMRKVLAKESKVVIILKIWEEVRRKEIQCGGKVKRDSFLDLVSLSLFK